VLMTKDKKEGWLKEWLPGIILAAIWDLIVMGVLLGSADPKLYQEAVSKGAWPAYLPPRVIVIAAGLILFSLLLSFVSKTICTIHLLLGTILFFGTPIVLIIRPEPIIGNLILVFYIIIGYSISILGGIPEIYKEIQKSREESRRIRLEMEKYSSILEGWRREGYNVSDPEKVLEDERMRYTSGVRVPDFSKIESAFNEYERKISRLKALEAELNSLASSVRSLGLDFSDRISSIRGMLRDPSKLNEVESDISALRDEIAMVQAKLKIDLWKERGYDVSRLYEFLEVRNLSMVEKRLGEYEEAALSIKELSEQGFDTSGLERLLREGEIDGLKYNLGKFNRIVQEMNMIEKDVRLLGTGEFTEEVSILKRRSGDLGNIEDIEEYVPRLKKKVAEAVRESKIRPWERKLDEWLRMGYDLSWLRPGLEKYSVEVEESLKKYERVIQEISQLKNELNTFKIATFNFEIFSIEKRLMKGEEIDKILKEISSLRQRAQGTIEAGAKKWLDERILKVKEFMEGLSVS